MKALLKYRIKSVLPALIVGIVVLIAAVVFVFVDFRILQNGPFGHDCGTLFLDRLSSNLMVLPYLLLALAIWMGMVLTKDYGNKERENFLDALPCKRSTRFLASIMPGVLYFLLTAIVLSIAICISHSVSYEYFRDMNMFSPYFEDVMECDSLGNALLVIWNSIISALMIFLATFFAGVVSRNKLVSVFILMAICLFSVLVPEVKYGVLADISIYHDAEYAYDTFFIVYSDMWPKIITVGALSVMYGILSYIVAVKLKRESGKLIVNDVCERIGIIIAGIYGAFLVRFAMKVGEVNTAMVIIVMIMTFVIIVYGLNRLVTGKGKYGFLNTSLIVMLLLTGCGNAKFPGDIYEHKLVYRGIEHVEMFKELFMQTSIKDYMYEMEGLEEGDVRISISPEKIIEKYAEENNREVVEVSKEEWREFSRIGINNQDEFRYVIDNEIIYIENSEGKIVKDRACLLLSRCEDLKTILLESDNELLYEVLLEIDNSVIEQVESKSVNFPGDVRGVFNCHVWAMFDGVGIGSTSDFTWNEAEYLLDLQKMDGFNTEYGASNDSGDSLSLMYDGEPGDENIDFMSVNSVMLDMYGKDGKLKEFRLVVFDSLEEIPVRCKPTIENCLLNLGCTKDDVAEFFANLPDKDTKVGNLKCSVDKMQGKYKIIKLYSE